ncbi:hypothetical protein JOL62DRAFT_381798 [Phyllosticta paracitricarpa]|uniref:Uncharacterized protein n=1 Tax=Phyllosticta paracitricarpa TaxID=2016321 RepID=A0ABR1NFA8_9PEZI
MMEMATKNPQIRKNVKTPSRHAPNSSPSRCRKAVPCFVPSSILTKGMNDVEYFRCQSSSRVHIRSLHPDRPFPTGEKSSTKKMAALFLELSPFCACVGEAIAPGAPRRDVAPTVPHTAILKAFMVQSRMVLRAETALADRAHLNFQSWHSRQSLSSLVHLFEPEYSHLPRRHVKVAACFSWPSLCSRPDDAEPRSTRCLLLIRSAQGRSTWKPFSQ